MLHKSSLFNMLLASYKQQSVSEKIIELITQFETDFNKRIPIQNITKDNHPEVLNNALNYIENSIQIKSWTEDLRLNILRNKNTVSKRFEIEQIRVSNDADNYSTIKEMTNKTDRAKLKQFYIKEQTLQLEQELSEVKINLECAEMFANEAKSAEELAYAYYQAVKNLNTEYIK